MNNLQMFAQMAQQRPQLPAGNGPMQQAGQSPVQAPPSGALPPQMATNFKAPELAALGRMGDSIVAHLTPGEIQVPPEMQTPKVLATLKSEFEKRGADPSQFVAGSKASSVNPQTGMPEYNFWSTFLPIALGIGGSLIAPGIGTALGSSLGSAALGAMGGGLGTTVGGLATGKKPLDALLTGAMSGVGSYGLGQLLGPGSEAVSTAAKEGASAGAASGASAGAEGLIGPTLSNATTSQIPAKTMDWARQGLMSNPNSFSSLYGLMPEGTNIYSAAGGALGGMLGDSMTAKPTNAGPQLPSGFTDKMPAVGDLPSWQQLLGQNTYKGPTPQFANYNPATNSPTNYRFYPVNPISAV